MQNNYPIELNIKLDIDNKKAKINIIKTTDNINNKNCNFPKNLLNFEDWDTEVTNLQLNGENHLDIKDNISTKSYNINLSLNDNDNKEELLDFNVPKNSSTILSYNYNNIFVLKNYNSPIKYTFKINTFNFTEDDYKIFNSLCFQLKDNTNTMITNSFIKNFFKKTTNTQLNIFNSQDEITEIIIFDKILKYAINSNIKYFILLKDYFRPTIYTNKIFENIYKLYTCNNSNKILIYSNKNNINVNDIKLIIIPYQYYNYLSNIINQYDKSLIKIYESLLNSYNENVSLFNNKIFEI